MEYSAQRQAGSVVVYVLVGVLLAAMAVGAIIVAQNRGSQQDVRRPATEAPAVPVAQDDKKKTADKQADTADNAAKDKRAAEEKAAKEKAQAEAKQQAAAALAAEKKAAAEKAAQQAPAPTDGPMARTGGAQSTALPTTGPVEDALSMVVGLVAIAGAGYFYYHFGRRS